MNSLNHISFIMDGNGRWAKKQNKPRFFGHKAGAKKIKDVVKWSIKKNIKNISLFAFSTENWSRSKAEVDFLINLLSENIKLKKNLDWLNSNEICFKWIGFEENLNKKLINSIKNLEEKTKNNSKINLYILFNYGFKKDLEESINKMKNDSTNSTTLNNFLLTSSMPQIDLLIRTSNEQRISNFAMYNLLYTEIIFEKKLWPDYSYEDFLKNINTYNKRNRRFGNE